MRLHEKYRLTSHRVATRRITAPRCTSLRVAALRRAPHRYATLMSSPPLYWTWDGEAMWPAGRFERIAREHFTRGQVYRLVEDEERSSASHKQFFAAVREAWQNLPEDVAVDFPTETHLRKWALIETGYYVQLEIALPLGVAIEVAKFLKQIDEFARVVRIGESIFYRRAKSQSRREMKKKEFQESKTAVLDLLATMIGTTPQELSDAGRAA